MTEPEWMPYPIDCQKMADLAGVEFTASRVARVGRVRYCRTHNMRLNLSRLSRGGPCVLVSSSSDSCVTRDLVNVLPPRVKRWFATNVMVTDPRVEAVPIGFVLNQERLEALKAQGRLPRPPQVNLMYVNFNRFAPALCGRRQGLYEQFGGFPWVTMKGGWSAWDVPPADFYREMASHQFIMSPPGAGPDCHRHWEAIALGSIPVVLRSPATRILDDMPALQLDSWVELTRNRLEAAVDKLMPRFQSPAMRKLSMKYWTERITSWA